MTIRLYLIRHCPTAAPPGTFIGATDLPVDPDRSGRITRLRDRLPEDAVCWCSPLQRARQTCQLLDLPWAREPRIDPRLAEMDFGRWEGLDFAQISSQDSALVADWQQDHLGFTFPAGESVAHFHGRLEQMRQAFKAQGTPHQVVISHGGPIRVLICLLLGVPLTHYLLFAVEHGGLTIIDLHSQGGVLCALNL